MKVNLVIHPKATGGLIEVRSLNKKQKAYVIIGNVNGHYYLQYHDSKGFLTSYIRHADKGFYNDDGLKMPKYIQSLAQVACNYLAQLIG